MKKILAGGRTKPGFSTGRQIAAIVTALLVALAVLIPFASASAAGGPPVWAVGDKWEYNVHYDSGTGKINDGLLKTEVTDTTDPVYTLKVDYDPDASRIDTGTGMAVTVPDAEAKMSKANLQYKGLKSNISLGSFAVVADITWTYTPTDPVWPPVVGATWDFSRHTVVAPIIDKTDSRQSKVLAEEDVTVPAGTFSCLHIVEYDPANPSVYTYEHWFSDAVGSDVKMIDRETFKGVETRELKSTTYVPPSYTLTVNATHGSVTRDPEMTTYPMGTKVKLTAVADAGYYFTGWAGAATGTSSPVTITMDGDKTVTANFEAGAGGPYTLTVNATNGSVTKNPNLANYPAGTKVTLTAVPSGGYHFTGWSGAVTGTTNPVDITMDSDKTVTANFAVDNFTLTVNVNPPAGGSVTKNPNQAEYLPGTKVTLTAVSAAGYHFTNWSGDASGTANPVDITIYSDKTVTANFSDTYTLTVNANPPAGGSVTKVPDQVSYKAGTQVKLTAVPNGGYHFDGWSGALTGTTRTKTITMDKDKTVTANFAINNRRPYTLTVDATNGSVTRDPDVAKYPKGIKVILTAVPNDGYHFTGWSGAASGTTNPVTITIDGNKTVTASFAINTYTLTVNASHGSVTRDPDQAEYPSGATVTLTAVPNDGYHFTGWSGDASGTTNPVDITMDADKTVIADFAINATVPSPAVQEEPMVAGPIWYLAEGSTAWGFDEYISIENPNAEACTAKITYMTTNGASSPPNVTLPAMSQTTVNPRDYLGEQDFSTKVECTDGKTIAVDRTMSWTGPGAASPEAHSSTGVTSPESTWYLPEGSTAWGFECWLVIQNPNTSEATCTVTYMTEGEAPKTVVKKVPASSRATFDVSKDIGSKDASIRVTSDVPVIPERAMYRNNRREGHESIGTTTPASDYFLAEGTTAWGFTTYVLVQNPNDSAANVTVTYMTGAGPRPQVPFSMPANSRKTIRVNDILPNTDLSTQVHADKPIIAERSMYWGAGTPLGEATHDSIGMASPHRTFYLPDGETSNGRETWTLVQNPNAEQVTVEITYLAPTGQGNKAFTDTIPARSRKTYNLADQIPSGRAAIMVASTTAGKKIMCERAMYWNSRGAGTDTIGGYSD